MKKHFSSIGCVPKKSKRALKVRKRRRNIFFFNFDQNTQPFFLFFLLSSFFFLLSSFFFLLSSFFFLLSSFFFLLSSFFFLLSSFFFLLSSFFFLLSSFFFLLSSFFFLLSSFQGGMAEESETSQVRYCLKAPLMVRTGERRKGPRK